MNQDRSRLRAHWSIFQIVAPGHTFPRYVMAHNVKRALELAVRDDDFLDPNQHLIAWNVTGAFMTTTNLMSRHTWELLQETREGRLDYDYTSGWIRLEGDAW